MKEWMASRALQSREEGQRHTHHPPLSGHLSTFAEISLGRTPGLEGRASRTGLSAQGSGVPLSLPSPPLGSRQAGGWGPDGRARCSGQLAPGSDERRERGCFPYPSLSVGSASGPAWEPLAWLDKKAPASPKPTTLRSMLA